ncbi:Dipeptidyl aminopeptidase [Apophysomyces ossiformis]|uniref:Prolyl endopeptidase n=1 Tax=Apophysomyces ossiformis TaxID=679940 RepID=A0A8H7BN94_9FUNG|nr:Dipeptidyl aminopeptidase [Apophysomyces ossiformis]
MVNTFIPACVETGNVPEPSIEIINDFESYASSATPCQFEAFAHNTLNQAEALYFRKRPQGSESEELYYVSAALATEATRITYLTGKGKGNTIGIFKPVEGDEDENGEWRSGGAICTIDTNGEEFFQLYRFLPVEGGIAEESHLLEAWTPAGSLTRNFVVSPDGSKVLYTCNARNGKDTDIYLRHLKQRPAGEPLHGELIAMTSGISVVYSWNADNSKALIAHNITSVKTVTCVLDIATGQLDHIQLPNRDGNGFAARITGKFSKTDPNILYLNTTWMSEYTSCAVYDLQSKAIRPITTPGLEDSLLPIHWPCFGLPSKRHLLLYANVDGYSKVYLMNLSTEKINKVDIPADIAGQIKTVAFSEVDEEVIVVSMESVSSPGTLYKLSVKDFSFTSYRATEHPRPSHPISIPKLIRYPSFDDLFIPSFVYLPAPYDTYSLDALSPAAKLPVIIYLHGGPASQHLPAYNPRLYLQYLVQTLGVCIIAPNVRGSSGYGISYMQADDGYQREDSVKDVGALLDYISTSMPYLDSARVAVMGRSYGGYMSFACMTHYSDRLKCGVETCGISNWVTFLETTAEHRRDHRRAEYGDERDPDMRKFLIEISPLTNADKITVPCFMSHGRNDSRVPFSEFEQMKAILQKNNGHDKVWTFAVDNEGHIYQQKSVGDAQVVCIAMFLKRFL